MSVLRVRFLSASVAEQWGLSGVSHMSTSPICPSSHLESRPQLHHLHWPCGALLISQTHYTTNNLRVHVCVQACVSEFFMKLYLLPSSFPVQIPFPINSFMWCHQHPKPLSYWISCTLVVWFVLAGTTEPKVLLLFSWWEKRWIVAHHHRNVS